MEKKPTPITPEEAMHLRGTAGPAVPAGDMPPPGAWTVMIDAGPPYPKPPTHADVVFCQVIYIAHWEDQDGNVYDPGDYQVLIYR